MSIAGVTPRLIVVGGWGVSVEMLSELYGCWPGEVVPVSLDDGLLSRCHSVPEVADELLSLYPGPSVWMGWSLGSQVVMEAASRETGAVVGVITLAGFPRFVADDEWPSGMPAGDFRAFRQGINRDPQRYWLHFLLLMINGSAREREERQRLKPWLESGPRVTASLLGRSLDWLQSGDQRALWRSLSIPALHIQGERDLVVRSWTDHKAAEVVGSQVTVPGMAHWPGGSYASDCREAVQAFLASDGYLAWAC